MARRPRLHVPGGCYHVTLRGNHREAIFSTEQDRHVLNRIVGEVIDKCDARIHAFCWMTNHLHMLIQVPNLPLGDIVRRIAQRYAKYRHRQLKTGGHLFERRHGAKLVEVDSYFLTALKYIHLNPVSADIVTEPSCYPWTSHHAFLGSKVIPWLTTDFGLSLFSQDRACARAAYRRFMRESLSEDERKAIEESNSGSSEVIGTDSYVERIRNATFSPRSSTTLEELVDRICTEYDTTLELLLSSQRSRDISSIRAELASRAIDGRIASLSEVARLLRRNPSSIYRLLDRRRCNRDKDALRKKAK